MTRTRRHACRYGAAALLTAVASGAIGWAQTQAPKPAGPAARLLPARPLPPRDLAIVSRGAAPEAGTFGDTRPKVQTLTEQRVWTGKPIAAQPPTASARPPAPAPVPVKQQFAPPPSNVPPFASGQGGVYAGPPAWRWYGYGTTTPGGNPLAPTGQYPKGSANWYAQTGATPGAFPVPVSAGGEPVARYEPPAYAGGPPPVIDPPARPLPRPEPRTEPVFTLPPEPARTATPPTVVPPPTLPPLSLKTAPSPVPSAEPPPIAVSTPAPPPEPTPPPVIAAAKPELPPAVAAAKSELPPALMPVIAPTPPPVAPAGLTWQTASGPKDTLTFTAAKPVEPPPAPVVTPVPAPPAVTAEPPPVQFKPSLPAPPTIMLEPTPAPPPVVVPPSAADWKAAKPQARGQLADGSVSLASQVRNACYGRATVAEVTHTGPSSLTVRLAAPTEADARAAAGEVAKVPALRPYTVRFVIELGGR